MATFVDNVTEHKCSSLHRVVKNDDDKYLCFTRLSTEFVVGVTDGVTLWKVDLDEEEADNTRDLAGITTLGAFLTRLR